MTDGTLSIEIAQLKHKRFETKQNKDLILERIEKSEADLIIFPEMFLTGYSLGSEIARFAQDRDSPLIGEIADRAGDQGKYVVIGYPRKSEKLRGQIHNSAGIFGPEGVVGNYDKLHLVDFGPFEEYAYFTPGSSTLSFDVMGLKFGILICYDIFFPELTKSYALQGADAAICISASPSITRRFFEIEMKARAVENTIYFIYSNLVGFDSRMDFWGGGSVIDPKGNEIVKGPYFEEKILTATLDPEIIEEARRSRPTLRDTRRDILEELLNIRK